MAVASLPTELDFVKNPEASPTRMNGAMAYIVARLRAVEAVTPDYILAIDALKAVGLERLAEALTPIFTEAEAIAAQLEAIQAAWVTTNFRTQIGGDVLDILREDVPEAFDDLLKMANAIIAYRSKYLGSKAVAPTLDDNGVAVAAGAMYFDTVLNKMRVFNGATWTDAGSVVQGLMARQAFTAVGGETTVAVTGGYDPGNIIVAKNGLTLLPTDITVTSGTNIVFAVALSAADKISWTKFTAISIANVYTRAEVDDLLDEAMAWSYVNSAAQ